MYLEGSEDPVKWVSDTNGHSLHLIQGNSVLVISFSAMVCWFLGANSVNNSTGQLPWGHSCKFQGK